MLVCPRSGRLFFADGHFPDCYFILPTLALNTVRTLTPWVLPPWHRSRLGADRDALEDVRYVFGKIG